MQVQEELRELQEMEELLNGINIGAQITTNTILGVLY